MSKADNKIRIIDLLNKIANGEEVKEFIYKGYIYQRHDCGYYRSVINSNWIGFHTDFDICSKEILNDYALLEDNTEEIEEKSNFENMGYEIAQAYFEFYKGIAKALTEKRKESEDKQ